MMGCIQSGKEYDNVEIGEISINEGDNLVNIPNTDAPPIDLPEDKQDDVIITDVVPKKIIGYKFRDWISQSVISCPDIVQNQSKEVIDALAKLDLKFESYKDGIPVSYPDLFFNENNISRMRIVDLGNPEAYYASELYIGRILRHNIFKRLSYKKGSNKAAHDEVNWDFIALYPVASEFVEEPFSWELANKYKSCKNMIIDLFNDGQHKRSKSLPVRFRYIKLIVHPNTSFLFQDEKGYWDFKVFLGGDGRLMPECCEDLFKSYNPDVNDILEKFYEQKKLTDDSGQYPMKNEKNKKLTSANPVLLPFLKKHIEMIDLDVIGSNPEALDLLMAICWARLDVSKNPNHEIIMAFKNNPKLSIIRDGLAGNITNEFVELLESGDELLDENIRTMYYITDNHNIAGMNGTDIIGDPKKILIVKRAVELGIEFSPYYLAKNPAIAEPIYED